MKLNIPRQRAMLIAAALSGSLFLAACGGGADSSPPTTQNNPGTTVPPGGTTTTPPTGTTTTPPASATMPNHNTAQTAIQAAMQATTELDRLANTIPTFTSAAAYLTNTDSCYLQNGRNNAFSIANINSDLAAFRARNAFQVGQSISNVQVTGDTVTTNPNGSTRRRVSFSYLITYTDGAKDNVTSSIISGSSQGTCASPTDNRTWRFLGNQRIADVGLRNQNQYSDDYSRSTGAAIRQQYRREVQLLVSDPANIADYAIVSAPIMQRTAAGGTATAPLSYKLLSPRILRSAPELAGKRGVFTNAGDQDTFSICLFNPTSGNYGFANNADCAGAGAQGNGLTTNLTIPAASPSLVLNDARITQADNSFNTFWNLSAGVTFTFALYKDDGWKTVNGQAGKTPVATYTAVLSALPFTFLEMNNGAGGHFRYASTSNVLLNGADARLGTSFRDAVANGAGALTFDIAAATSPNSPNNFRLGSASQYFEGPLTTNAAGVTFPAQYFDNPIYPGGNATAASFSILPRPVTISAKTFNQFVLTYTDRDNGNRIRSRSTLQ